MVTVLCSAGRYEGSCLDPDDPCEVHRLNRENEQLRSEVEKALLFLDGYRTEGRVNPPAHGDCNFCFSDCQRGLEILESLLGARSGEPEGHSGGRQGRGMGALRRTELVAAVENILYDLTPWMSYRQGAERIVDEVMAPEQNRLRELLQAGSLHEAEVPAHSGDQGVSGD